LFAALCKLDAVRIDKRRPLPPFNTTQSRTAIAQATDCMIKPNKDVLVFYLIHSIYSNPNLLDGKELDLEVQGRANSSA